MRNSNIAPAATDPVRATRRVAAMLATALVFATQAHAQSSDIKLQDAAPDRYIVQQGDTLWNIAGKFLKEPFRWPEIWRMNQDQIRNPNRIYPGNVIVLDRTQNPPQLSLISDTIKLSPQVRSSALSEAAIPAIRAKVIEPFLTQPLVIEAAGLDKAPRIVATQESRVHLGPGGLAYVSGISSGQGSIWQIYRPGKALVDPETKATLGYEAVFLGTGRVQRAGEPATMEIVSSRQEITSGDRLIAAAPPSLTQYIPHAPKVFIRGRVIGMYDGLATSESGRDSVVTLNKGKRDGVEDGHVFAILRAGSTVADPDSSKSRDSAPTFRLPDERYGLLFVFRVFDAVSYALVMESTRPVAPSDIIQTP